MTAATESLAAATKTLRDFIRGNAKLDGAMDALDALRSLEDAALTATGERERERAYSTAIVDAQAAVKAAIKDKSVELRGGGGYDVAETEQILSLCRDAMAPVGLALEVGDSLGLCIEGAAFARIGFGLRHREGYVHRVTRDFPLQGAGPVFWRQTNTSALGYFLRDAFALPRRKDEGEQAAARTTSGPRRSGAPAAATPPAKKATPIADIIARIKTADAAGLEKAGLWLEDRRFEAANDGCPYSDKDLADVGAAIGARRTEIAA
jgi:hypothetical protein